MSEFGAASHGQDPDCRLQRMSPGDQIPALLLDRPAAETGCDAARPLTRPVIKAVLAKGIVGLILRRLWMLVFGRLQVDQL